MTGFPESKLDWLVEKFGEYQGWINASDIRSKIYPKYKAKEFNKLMALAIEKGWVFDSQSIPRAPKNSIAFNLPQIEEFFDSYLVEDPFFKFMPGGILGTTPWIENDEWFRSIAIRWRVVYGQLCSLQYHGVFDESMVFDDFCEVTGCDSIGSESLSDPLICAAARQLTIDQHKEKFDNYTKSIVFEAKEIASTYKLIKFGWAEIKNAGYFLDFINSCPVNHNEVFLKYLWDKYRRYYWVTKNRQPVKLTDRTMLDVAKSIDQIDPLDMEYIGDELLKKNNKAVNKLTGHTGKSEAEEALTYSAYCYDVKKILQNSSDRMVKEALKELKTLHQEQREIVVKGFRKKGIRRPSKKN
jgi:hypothetical protein